MADKSDPSYQAYLRALGFDKTIARNDAALQTSQAIAGAKLAKPELMAQGVEAREGISDSFEDRGMFLGSERLRGLANQRRNETYRLAMIDKTAADEVADIDMGLQRELHGVDKQRLQAERDHQAYLDAVARQDAAEAAGGDGSLINVILQQPGLPGPPTPLRPYERPVFTEHGRIGGH